MLRMRFNCNSVECVLCGCTDVETHQHLFGACPWYKELKSQMQFWLSLNLQDQSLQASLDGLKKQKGPRLMREFTAGVYAGLVYQTWTARKAVIFRQEVAATHVHLDLLKKELQARLQKKVSSKDAGRCRDLFD